MIRLLALLLSVVAVACVPTVDGHEAELSAPRVLAVRADPPEVAPNRATTFTALYADASGELTTAPIDWAYCLIRKPLAELGEVASGCVALQGTSDQFTEFGSGITATGAMPSNACTLFGPNPPPATRTMPSGRPVDPDATGGYMQPLRLLVTEQGGSLTPVIAQQRIACGIAGATLEHTREFTRRYRLNGAPTIASLRLVRGSDVADLGDTPIVVNPGELLTLRVEWPKCPESADVCGDTLCGIDEDATSCAADCDPTNAPPPSLSCAGAERYLRFDSASSSFVVEREAISLAWFASQGTFAANTTGVTADDLTTQNENQLTAPSTPGDFVVVVVIRDNRGAANWSGTARLRVGN